MGGGVCPNMDKACDVRNLLFNAQQVSMQVNGHHYLSRHWQNEGRNARFPYEVALGRLIPDACFHIALSFALLQILQISRNAPMSPIQCTFCPDFHWKCNVIFKSDIHFRTWAMHQALITSRSLLQSCLKKTMHSSKMSANMVGSSMQIRSTMLDNPIHFPSWTTMIIVIAPLELTAQFHFSSTIVFHSLHLVHILHPQVALYHIDGVSTQRYLTDHDGHTIHRPNFWVDIKLLNSLVSYKSLPLWAALPSCRSSRTQHSQIAVAVPALGNNHSHPVQGCGHVRDQRICHLLPLPPRPPTSK